MYNERQINKCQAWTIERKIPCQIQNAQGEVITLKDPIFLRSYNSVVAIYDRDFDVIYKLPRWKFSRTTVQHFYKFARMMGDNFYTKICNEVFTGYNWEQGFSFNEY